MDIDRRLINLNDRRTGVDRKAVDMAAIDIDPSPTEAQKAAGTYRKGHAVWNGIPITLENAKGATRSGIGPDGTAWSCVQPAHYGYIKRTTGADGDHIDVYIGPDEQAPHIYVIDQIDHGSGEFDEHKCMLGFAGHDDALACYDAAFSDGHGPDRRGAVATMSIAHFKRWLKSGDTQSALLWLAALADDGIDDATLTDPVVEKRDDRRKELAALLLLFLLRSRWDTLITLGWSRGEDGTLIAPEGHGHDLTGPAGRDGTIHVPGGLLPETVALPDLTAIPAGELPTIAADPGKLLLHRLAETKATEGGNLLTGVSRSELDQMVKSALDQATTLIDQVDATTVKQLTEAATTAREVGPLTEDVAKAIVDDVFAEAVGPRTDTAAVTETAMARAKGSTLGTQRAGLKSMIWRTELDDKVRPNHQALEGQVRNIGRMFDSPDGDRALGPGGFSKPENSINCRCQLEPFITPASDFSISASWHNGEAQRQRDENEFGPLLRRMYEDQKMAVLDRLNTAAADAGMRLEAMSLDVPDVPGHPNRRPFSGILTRIDEPSDKAPHGSGGRRVLITRAAAEAALPSLLGMGINFTDDLTGHDPTKKVGVITDADIDGSAIRIRGFFYIADNPREVAKIIRDQRLMGFSFDTGPFSVENAQADPLVVTKVVFTGAAVLRKASAAYTSTSLAAAAASTGEDAMAESEAMTKLLAEFAKVTTTLAANSEALAAQAAEIKTLKAGGLAANSTVIGMVKPHADKLAAAADDMMAAGIGCHAQNGHGPFLKRMAASMMASAAEGKMPHVFSDHDYRDQNLGAGADDVKPAEVKTMIDTAIAAATKPLADQLAAAATVNADLKAKLDTLSAGGSEAEGGAPVRKTLSASALAAVGKFDLKPGGEDGDTLSASAISQAMSKAGKTPIEIMAFKRDLQRGGATIIA